MVAGPSLATFVQKQSQKASLPQCAEVSAVAAVAVLLASEGKTD